METYYDRLESHAVYSTLLNELKFCIFVSFADALGLSATLLKARYIWYAMYISVDITC